MTKMGNPSRILTFEDAIGVWLKYWDGWLQSRIAAHYDVNQGRVSEVITGKRHPGSEQEALWLRGAAA